MSKGKQIKDDKSKRRRSVDLISIYLKQSTAYRHLLLFSTSNGE